MSCEFLKPPEPSKTSAWDMPVTQGAVVTGMPDGSLLLWRGGKAIKRVEAHGRGQRTIQPDGTVAWGGGVRALRLRSDGLTLLTGGADGCIRQWDASKNTVGNQVTDPVSLAKYSARMETPDDDEEQDEAITRRKVRRMTRLFHPSLSAPSTAIPDPTSSSSALTSATCGSATWRTTAPRWS